MRTYAQIRNDILAEISSDPKVEFTNVFVTVAGGVVTMHSHVHSYCAELAAIKAASRIKGGHAGVSHP